MAQYSTNNRQAGALQAVAAAYKTLAQISAATATLRRAFLTEMEFGADGVPSNTDCSITYDWSRSSTIVTGTAATPSPLDSADAAAGTVSTVNFTAEPTIGASLLTIAINQRNSQRWVAKDDKSRLVVPAVNLNGISGRALSSNYTANAVMTMLFDE